MTVTAPTEGVEHRYPMASAISLSTSGALSNNQVREFLAESTRRADDSSAIDDYRARVMAGQPYEDVVDADEFAGRYFRQ